MGMYEFKQTDAYDFARFVGIEARPKGSQLQLKTCPYCKGGKSRDKGTFAISLKNGMFKCLRNGCGITGNMITLSKDFDFSLGVSIDEYYKPQKQYKKLPTPKDKIIPKEPAIVYLESRGINKQIAEKYEITVQNGNDNVLVFPFYDDKGILQFVKYRKTDFDKTKDKNKEWCEANTKPILFGMKQCSGKFQKLIISEGQMDTLAIATAYDGNVDVASVPTGSKGFTFMPYCWDWLSKFKEIIIFGDYEKGEISLYKEFAKRFPNKVKHVAEKDYKDCKDANEILLKYGADQVKKCVENAELPPVQSVIKLSQVKNVDIYNLEKCSTGIKPLDRFLYGGLPFGFLTLVAGKRGKGKSTFASQILVNALQQNYTCFAYSGELPNYLFKSWIDFQIAGSRNIVETENQFGDMNRFLTNSVQAQINNWYDEKFYMYDNTIIDKDETTNILELIEKSILQYGVKVVLLDNLMTVMYLDETKGSDKYDRQGKFVRDLTILAMKYDVAIILVAHKRKTSDVVDNDDEVSGASDITNLAGLTIHYDEPTKKEIEQGIAYPEDRLIKLTKNRIFGRTQYDGWVSMYQDKSKRIYTNADDVEVQFGWKTNEFDDGIETPFD